VQKAIILTPKETLESLKIPVGHVNFASIKVRNRSKFNWGPGCYL